MSFFTLFSFKFYQILEKKTILNGKNILEALEIHLLVLIFIYFHYWPLWDEEISSKI